jgi:hypothetical protein
MGYDFSFVRLAPRPEDFPFSPPQDFDGALESLRNPLALEQQLLSGGFRKDRPPFKGTQHYRWDAPDGGSLDICIREDWINVDTHAHWKYVLKTYELLCEIEPELLILDSQSAVFYDAASYVKFVDESYARKA